MSVRLRPLEVAPFERGGQRFVRLRDPLGLSPSASGPGGRVLSAAQWDLVRRLDGATALEHAARAAGIDVGDAQGVVDELAHEQLLEDDATRRALDEAVAAFRRLEARPPLGAGHEYEADATELRIRIAGLVANDWDMPRPPELAGIWAPASGLRRRAALFARAYAAVRHHAESFERVLLVGAVPAPLATLLVPLDMDLATPYGTLTRDRAALALLPEARGSELLAQRASLVLERHALFLRLLLPRLPVVPVLVASLRAPAAEPAAEPELAAALDGLRAVLELPGRTLSVFACDLAELGGEPGPAGPASEARLQHAARSAGTGPDWIVTGTRGERLRTDDRRHVDALTRLDAAGLWALAARGENPLRRACAPLSWLAARLMSEHPTLPGGDAVAGSLLGYQQSGERTGLVSGASVVFH